MNDTAGMSGITTRAALASTMSLFAVVSILGNSLFWFALLYDKRAKMIGNAFLMNLSISDFVVGVWNMPITVVTVIAGRWLLGNLLCSFSAFVDNTMLLVSVWTVAWSSIDKHYMVEHPLHYHRNVTWARVARLIVGIWLVACLCNLPPLLQLQNLMFQYSPYSFSCGLSCPPNIYGQVYCLGYTVIFVPIPLVVISICYVRIFTIARAISQKDKARMRSLEVSAGHCRAAVVSDGMGCSRPGSDSTLLRRRQNKSNTITVLVIIGVMMSCLVPVILVGFISFIDSTFVISQEFFVAFHWLLLANSAVNPVLYGIVNPFFRRAYVKLLRHIKQTVWTRWCAPLGKKCRRVTAPIRDQDLK